MTFAALLAAADGAVLKALGEATPIHYTPAPIHGPAVDVSGIFDAAFVLADVGGASVISSGPAVFLRLSDLPGDPEEDDEARLLIGGVVYSIREPRKDGMGGVLLLLHEEGAA